MKGKHNPLLWIGLLLIAAALFLCAGNIRESNRAQISAQSAAWQLEQLRPANVPEETSAAQETEPALEMPVVTVEGREYIGTLSIPGLSLELGVLSRCTPEGLKIAPSRYTGNVYTGDLVIAAHNYASHFGALGQLQPGDAVILTDTAGNSYAYQVDAKEVLAPDAVEEMTESTWPLTLFTCTAGGSHRLTVRCRSAAA